MQNSSKKEAQIWGGPNDGMSIPYNGSPQIRMPDQNVKDIILSYMVDNYTYPGCWPEKTYDAYRTIEGKLFYIDRDMPYAKELRKYLYGNG